MASFPVACLLDRVTAAARHPKQVTLLQGSDLVNDLRRYLHNLLHPEPFAHIRLGLNLAEAMRKVVGVG